MRVIALLALFFGFTAQMFLDGQVFTHAVMGMVCGGVAVVCGGVSARRDREHRWTGWTIAALGLALAFWCGLMAPSGYQYQKRFNNKHREYRGKIAGQETTVVNRNAATPSSLREDGNVKYITETR